MRLTNKQRNEIDVLRYWIPENVSFYNIEDSDIQKFFNWSDKGINHNEKVMSPPWNGFKALYWAKNRRDLHVSMYLEDWGDTLNAWSFDDMPENITRDISKRMKKDIIKQ